MSRYSLQPAYIVSTGTFLPGRPVENDEIESILGFVDGKSSKYKKRILNSNGIKQRYYAVNNKGDPSHLTDEMAAESIKQALIKLNADQDTIDMIAVGTTLPDLLAPGIASMVHGRIGGKNSDILSCAGICGAGAAAFKAASLSVISGQHDRVVACGTERPSIIMMGHRFKQESKIQKSTAEESYGDSFKYFNADFLRWMLSDGAGSFIIDNKPKKEGLSLLIRWIESASFANELQTCMYMGTTNSEKLTTKNTWLSQKNISEAEHQGHFLLRQDIKLLHQNMPYMFNSMLKKLLDKKLLIDTQIDWFLPHISSMFFYNHLAELLDKLNIKIPTRNWFTNLTTKGNTGAASIYIMLDELFSSNKIKDGDNILIMVPESGRFSITFALLSAVNRTYANNNGG